MISSWETIIHKSLLKSTIVLKQELGKLKEEEHLKEGIMNGPLCKSRGQEELVEIFELTAELKDQCNPSIEVPPELELKQLPPHLRYAYLEAGEKFHVIIATDLSEEQRCQILTLLKKHKRVIAWKLSDIKGINLTIWMHIILLEENYKNSIECQRRLNHIMKEAVKKEIMKWLDAGIIYLISDSMWVSHIQCFPKKGGMIVVTTEKDEVIPTRTITGWRICMDYRKLSKVISAF